MFAASAGITEADMSDLSSLPEYHGRERPLPPPEGRSKEVIGILALAGVVILLACLLGPPLLRMLLNLTDRTD